MQGTEGINLLARALDSRIGDRSQRHDALELGVIQDDMSLLIDRFGIPIPTGQYWVVRSLTLPDPMTTTVSPDDDPVQGTHGHGPSGKHPHGPSGSHAQETGSGEHTHPATEGAHEHPDTEGAHQHDVVRPLELTPLQPGDRVLVAWVNDGVDAIVLDVVVMPDAS